MAYGDATRVDTATARMSDDSSEQTDFRAAVKVFGEAFETIATTHSLNAKDTQEVRDKIIDICRYVDACVR